MSVLCIVIRVLWYSVVMVVMVVAVVVIILVVYAVLTVSVTLFMVYIVLMVRDFFNGTVLVYSRGGKYIMLMVVVCCISYNSFSGI